MSHPDIIKRIEELVIEAAHEGLTEDEIMRAVNDGLDFVLGPPDEESEDEEEEDDDWGDESDEDEELEEE